MIQNERQYRITLAQIRRFEEAVSTRAASGSDKKLHPLLRKANVDAMRSQIESLRGEVRAYERLRSNGPASFTIDSIEDLPSVLVRARIALGLTQEKLAARLGLKAQQIQRYESAGYSGASWERIAEVMRALGIYLRRGVVASSPRTPRRTAAHRVA